MKEFPVKCQTVADILTNWPQVTHSDIPRIRDIVCKKYYPNVCMEDKGIITQFGEVFQEMMALHIQLNNGIINDREKLSNDEVWYITEWLKNNRVNYSWKGKKLFNYETKPLSRDFGDVLYWLINEILAKIPSGLESICK